MKGQMGPKGCIGDDGEKGNRGFPGRKGALGADGMKGCQGDPGPRGKSTPSQVILCSV